MRRALLAVLFFVALVAIWAALVHALVRTNRRCDAFCGDHGNDVVSDHCYRYRCAHDPTHLCPGRAHHGLEVFPQVDARYLAGVASISSQRDETRLGVCVAIAYGG